MSAIINYTCDICNKKFAESIMNSDKCINMNNTRLIGIHTGHIGKTKLYIEIKIKADQISHCVCEKCSLIAIKNEIEKKLKEVKND